MAQRQIDAEATAQNILANKGVLKRVQTAVTAFNTYNSQRDGVLNGFLADMGWGKPGEAKENYFKALRDLGKYVNANPEPTACLWASPNVDLVIRNIAKMGAKEKRENKAPLHSSDLIIAGLAVYSTEEYGKYVPLAAKGLQGQLSERLKIVPKKAKTPVKREHAVGRVGKSEELFGSKRLSTRYGRRRDREKDMLVAERAHRKKLAEAKKKKKK